jgi:glutamate:GABA antiporter
VNSIVFVGAMTFACSLAGIVGVGKQEGFQLLWNASAIFYALTYLVMFAIPIIGLRRRPDRAPLWLKLAAASGFLMTLLYVTLSILPIVTVTSRLVFALKISLVILVANAVGALLFVNSRRSAVLTNRPF